VGGLDLAVGAGHQGIPVGEVGVGRPDFLPVDDVATAVLPGEDLDGRQVGAVTRLAEGLAPHDLAGGDARQVAFFLRVAALEQQGRRHDAGADGVVAGGVVAGQLLAEDEAEKRRGVLAAVLFGPVPGKPAPLPQPLGHGPVHGYPARLAGHIEEGYPLLAVGPRGLLLQEGGYLFAEGLFFRAEGEVQISLLLQGDFFIPLTLRQAQDERSW